MGLMKLPTWPEEGDIVPRYFPNKSKMKRNTIIEGIKLYNSIRPEFRKLKPSRYKYELKKWHLFEQPKCPNQPTIKAIKKSTDVVKAQNRARD